MSPRTRVLWLAGAIAAGVVAALGAYAAAVSLLHGKVARALSPGSETSAIRVGLEGVVVEGLRIPAPSGWPAPDELRAERVQVAPSLRSLVSGDSLTIRSITVYAPYLSALRSRDGKLVVLPGLLGERTPENAPAESFPSAASPKVALGVIRLENGAIELFDATVATPALKIRLEQLEATLHDLSLPGLLGRSDFELDAVVKGASRDGRAHIVGWAELGTRDSSVTIELRGVDLLPLAPYLVRPGETRVRRGSVDLDLESVVTGARLDAHGTISISNLELASSPGLKNTFLGVSNSVVLARMKDRGDKLTLDFTFSGDVDHPDFSLNEALGTKLAFALAETLGVSVGGFAKGVGSLGVRGGHAAGEAVKGVGGAISDLFESKPKR